MQIDSEQNIITKINYFKLKKYNKTIIFTGKKCSKCRYFMNRKKSQDF